MLISQQKKTIRDCISTPITITTWHLSGTANGRPFFNSPSYKHQNFQQKIRHIL